VVRDDIGLYQNNVWGDPGKFTQAHEYGHALDHGALGAANTFSSFCPSPHLFDEPSNVKCAFTEGFANYHAFATWGTQIIQTLSWAEPNFFFDNADGDNGTVREDAVAAFLYDLTDAGSSESHDNSIYQPSQPTRTSGKYAV
jgi:hypothetical protein